jgi:uncharacterized protein (DUF1697 family)
VSGRTSRQAAGAARGAKRAGARRGARYIAFLRAINVGGHTVTMARLRRLFEEMGYGGVETFIASGNVVFEAAAASTAALEKTIAARLEKTLGYDVATFVRTPAELAAIAEYEAFRAADVGRARTHCVGFLAEPLGRAARAKLMALRTEVDDFAVHGREIHWLSHVRQSESAFSNAAFEKETGVRATFRGLNTVRKMAATYAAPGARTAH